MKPMTVLSALIGAAMTAALLSGCLPYSTGATEVGVRTIKWSPFGNKGVQREITPPGQTVFLPLFITDWNTFDTRLEKLEMTAVVGKGDRPGNDELLFKTVDGNDIGLDLTVQYRVVPEKAPMILQTVARDDEELKEHIMRGVARSKPRDIFGVLRTEDFYISENRLAKAEEVKKTLNEILGPYGIEVDRINLGNYKFNPEYEKAIEDKKVADQDAERTKSETAAKSAEFETAVETAKADVAKMREKADGEYRRAVIEADAQFAQQQRIAEAIIAEGTAEAQGMMKMNEALSGAGGEALVKLKMAEALTGKRIVMVPMGDGGLDVRTTDINALLKTYGIQALAAPKPKEPESKEAPPAPALPAPAPDEKANAGKKR